MPYLAEVVYEIVLTITRVERIETLVLSMGKRRQNKTAAFAAVLCVADNLCCHIKTSVIR